MRLKSCVLCLFCVLLLSACGKTLTSRIRNRTIGDDEHAVNVIRISDYVDLDEVLGQNADAPSGVVSGNDVICETCQYRYAGIMAGHCRNCLTELGDEEPVFYDYDIAMVMEGRHMLYMDADKISRDAYGRYLLEVMKDCMLPIQGHEEQWEASKFSVLIHDRDYPAVIELLKDDYDFMVHGDVAMEVVPKGYSKASGIAFVCEKLGIDVKDTYAFGDSANDVDMLEFAGVGVAMGDGTDVAKEHADYVTRGLHEDGIYHALKHFALI